MNILLICSAGMSTSMMMKRMKEAAASKHINATIWAVGEGLAKDHIPKADIILLGPQVRYLFQKIDGMAEGKPVMVIDLNSYGNLDGKKVLENVLIRMRGK
ncbi:PTS sugar transporter subunit IIB [bacterium c-19]|nr:PTS sugar transporter subunit IIB [bacterium c-19]